LLFVEYRLAEMLGGMTVKELRERMDLDEVVHWIAYWRYKAALMEQAMAKVAR